VNTLPTKAIPASIVYNCPKVVFYGRTEKDVPDMLYRACNYLIENAQHAEALWLDYNAEGVELVVYLHCDGPEGGD
jgi:hypothetical protein